MTIKKADLYDFIEMKTKTRRKELGEKREEAIKKLVEYQVNDLFADEGTVRDIDTALSHLQVLLSNLLKTAAGSERWAYNRISSLHDLVEYISSYGGIKEFAFGEMNSYINSRYSGVRGLTLVKDLKQKVEEYDRQINELSRLESQLKELVKHEKTAKRAYEKLQAVGVDLSDFETNEKQLPSVVTISADVSLINQK